jgi:hypothetical protein
LRQSIQIDICRSANGGFVAYRYLNARDGDVPADGIAEYPVIVVGGDATGDPDLVRVFRQNKEFRRWAAGSPIAETVETVFTTLEKQVLPERATEQWVEKMQTLAMKRKIADLKAFAKLVGGDVRDEEVVRLAMVDRTPLTPRAFDPMFLWDRRIEVEPPQGAPQDARTSTLPIPSGWWPWLGWVGWDNRPRSARVFGVNVLCENGWFGGRWAWLIGLNMLLNLDRIAFDRMASSVISF